jgi:hypothetical protein
MSKEKRPVEILQERLEMQVRRADMGGDGTALSVDNIKAGMKVYTAAERLAQLGFDPMMELIGVFREAEHHILNISGIDSRGKVVREPEKARSGAMVVASLIQTKSKIATDLLRYQHSRVNESTPVEQERDITPVTITLSGIDDDAQTRIAVKHNIVKQSDIDGKEIDAFALARKAAGHNDD